MISLQRKSMGKAISLVDRLQRRAKAERNFPTHFLDNKVICNEKNCFRVKIFYVFEVDVHSTCT